MGKNVFICLSQLEMRLFEILILLSGFCLAFNKAEIVADVTFDDSLDDQPGVPDYEAFVEDEPDITAEETLLGEDPTPVKRPIRRRPWLISLPIKIYGSINSVFFRACYCFKRRCYGKYRWVVSTFKLNIIDEIISKYSVIK